jgi:ABC-type transport system substrate-binding protein
MPAHRAGLARSTVRLAAALLALPLLVRLSPAGAQPLRVLNIAVGPDAESWDPRAPRTPAGRSIDAYVYDPLVGPNDERAEARPVESAPAKLVARLAESWQVSGDGRTYTFSLRRGVAFQDGSALDAAAVEANIRRWLGRRPMRDYFGDIDPGRIETPDPYTVILHLHRPSPVFLQRVATAGAILSPRALGRDQAPDDRALLDAGTGPYRLREWRRGERIALVRNPGSWRRAPAFDAVVFRVVADPEEREALLRAGRVQMAVGLPGPDLGALRRDPALRVLEEPSDEVVFVGLNTQWGPLRDNEVRQALNYAVDKRAIIRTLMPGLADVLDSPLPPLVFGYAPVERGGWPYDPLRARRLLRHAGYPHGFGIVLGTSLGWYTEDYQAAIAVAKQLENVGVTTPTPGVSASDVFVGPTATYLRWLHSPPNWAPPQLILGGWAAPYLDADAELFSLFARSQWPPAGEAASYYANPRVEALLRAAAHTADPARRQVLYRRAQALVWSDAPWIFLWSQHTYLATSRRLHNVTLLPTAGWAGVYAQWK